MLLWECLETREQAKGQEPKEGDSRQGASDPSGSRLSSRLPYEKRCGALNKAGTRCRGRILKGGEFCPFHDPIFMAKLKKARAAAPRKPSRRLTRLPDGYLRKLTNRAAVGEAMDRLYREIRLGLVTPEMGRVLFNVLARLLDSGLPKLQRKSRPGRADRFLPRLEEVLTRAERRDWRLAVANAPESLQRGKAEPERPQGQPIRQKAPVRVGRPSLHDSAIRVAVPAVS